MTGDETDSADVYAADGYFAVIPEWILDCPISSRAVHLYAVLRRYADQRTGMAHPSRRTLAGRLRVSDEKTVDRAVEELVRIGAVRVRRRYGNGSRARVQDGPTPEFPQQEANAYFLLARRHPERHYPTPSDTADVTESENGGGGGTHATPPPTSVPVDQGVLPGVGAPMPPPLGEESGEGWGHPRPHRGAPEGDKPKPERTTKNSSSSAMTERPTATGSYREEFAIFWQAYPRKVGKIAAEKAFAKAAKSAGPEVVLSGLERSTFPADPQFVPHPATWLNQGRWADEAPAAPAPAKETKPWEQTVPPASSLPAKEAKPWEL